eukprot:gb/GEZN01006716.1/.p1 GENE.gb/GEZN01006716.1/~~gb/GEZN01006716.1/.p1  ORF type:complete len:361 (-),score=19.70 gb/GEZN01006716.1/:436-1518(-)
MGGLCCSLSKPATWKNRAEYATAILMADVDGMLPEIIPIIVEYLGVDYDDKNSASLEGHKNSVQALVAFGENRLVSAGGFDSSMRVWDMESSSCLKTLQAPTRQRTIAEAMHNLWNQTPTFERAWGLVYALVVLRDGLVASGLGDHTVRLWDITQGVCVKTFSGHAGFVLSLAVLSRTRVCSGSADQTVRVWDTVTGRCVQTLKGHADHVRALAVMNETSLASGAGFVDKDFDVRMWDLEAGTCIRRLIGHTGDVWALLTLSETLLASGSSDDTVRIWNVKTGDCLHVCKGHTAPVTALTSITSNVFASASSDQTVRLWSVSSGECVQVLEGHECLASLAVLPDGRLAAGSYNGLVRLWA